MKRGDPMTAIDGRIRAAALAVLAAVALAVPGPAGAAPRDERAGGKQPNVLVVMTDDVPYGDLQLMPSYQRLKRLGTTFTRAYASYPLCCPARATLLTGQYAHNHGVKSNFFATGGGFDGFDGQDDILPTWLQEAGYRTAFVGKYLNEYGGRDRDLIPPGWDDWHGLVDYSTYNYFNWAVNHNGSLDYYGDRDYIDALIELARLTATDAAGTPAQALARSIEIYDPIEDIGSENQDDYQPDATGEFANDALERAMEGEKPFFLYYAPIAAHRETDYEEFGGIRDIPLEADPRPPERYEDTYDHVELPRDPSFNEEDVSDKPEGVSGRDPISDERIDEMTADYRGALGALRAADDGLARMLDTLEESGELDDTIVIYTADQGFMQGQHRIDDHKYIPYEPSIRLPLVIAGPGIPKGEQVDGLVAAQDMTATIVDAAGAKAGRDADGVSLLPHVQGKRLPDREILLEALAPTVEFEIGNEAIDAQVPYFGLRTERYKYISWSFGDEELYDLQKDPYELENVAEKRGYADVRERLAERAKELSACAGPSCYDPDVEVRGEPAATVEHRQVGQATAIAVLAALAAALLAGIARTVRAVRHR